MIGFDENINQNLLNQFNIKLYVDCLNKNINRNINGIKVVDIENFVYNIKILILKNYLFSIKIYLKNTNLK